MSVPDPVTLGRQARRALWGFSANTRLQGVTRDRAALAFVRSELPRAAEVFTPAQLTAVTRELQGGTCSWDALRQQLAAQDESMPEPTAALTALLGQPCSRCKRAFRAAEQQREAAKQERARLVAAATRPAPTPTRAASAGRRRYFGSRPLGQPWR